MTPNHSFYRSKLKDPAEMAALVAKVAAIQAKKPNAFNVEFKGLKMPGVLMTALVFTDPAKITFTYKTVQYELALTDIEIVKRVRSRKFVFKTNVLTVVP